ncbi:hypothetical protein EMGBS15_15600 [Filimonas sp.]|nr:hypothetical protein EMGBS15_15600 [Filimonas sp.]
MTPGPDYVAAEYKSLLTYKNKKTGQTQDFDQTNFPWQDTLTWVFVDSKSEVVKEAKNEPPIKDFVINTYDGKDITADLLKYQGYLLVLFVKDVDEANTSNMEALRSLEADCKKAGVQLIALSASNDIATRAFNEKNKLSLNFFTIDGTVCKTAMRSNPGMMLLKEGNILGKWSYADYPTLSSLKLGPIDNSGPLFPPPADPAPVSEDSLSN